MLIRLRRIQFKSNVALLFVMTSQYAIEDQNQWISKISLIINLIRVVLTLTKYLPHIVFSLATFSILLSIIDFIQLNYIVGVIHIVFGIGGIIFIVQTVQWNNNEMYLHRKNNTQSLMIVTTLVGLKNNLTISEDLKNRKRKVESDLVSTVR